jgi:hypothetical protein
VKSIEVTPLSAFDISGVEIVGFIITVSQFSQLYMFMVL